MRTGNCGIRFLLMGIVGICLLLPTFGKNFYMMSSHPSKYEYQVDAVTRNTNELTTAAMQREISYWPITATVPSGLKFLGWYTREGGWPGATDEPTVESAEYRLTDSKTLYPKDIDDLYEMNWTSPWFGKNAVVVAKYIPVYAVNVTAEPAEGGTAAIVPDADLYEDGQRVTLRASVNEDYLFAWWNRDGQKVAGSDGQATLEQTVTAKAAYVAVFTQKVIRVSLTVDPNGGVYDNHTSSYEYREALEYGSTRSNQISIAKKEGFRLDGYYAVNERVYDGEGRCVRGSSCWDSDGRFLRKEGLLVQARWEAKSSTVTLNADGGTGQVNSITAIYGEDLPPVVPPVREGYEFCGFFTEKNGAGDKYYDSDGTSYQTWNLVGDRTLYAFWVAQSYTLTVLAEEEGDVVCERTYRTATTNQTLQIVLPQKSGYAIACWSATGATGGDPTVQDDVVTIPFGTVGNIVLTPTWVPQFYVVAFDGNGAKEVKMPEQEFLQGITQALSVNTFVRTGYVFGGWTNLLANVRYADGEVVTDIAEVGTTNTLKAVWLANDYRVRFFGNGGVGTMNEQAFAYGEVQNLTSNAFVREGCDFAGWATDPAKGVAYADGAAVSDLTADDGGVVSLFAKWTPRGGGLDNLLSVAADCATNMSDRVACELIETTGTCSVENGTDVGGNGQYVKIKPLNADSPSTLSLTLKGSGTLLFAYKVVANGYLEGNPYGDNNNFEMGAAGLNIETNVSNWTVGRYRKDSPNEETVVWLFNWNHDGDDDYACVDNIRWMPDVRDEGTTVGVTFRMNDGTPAPADIFTNVTRVVGQAIGELPEPTSASGRTFVAWTSGGTAIDETWAVPSAADGLQLLAKWEGGPDHREPGPDDAVKVSSATVGDGQFTLSFAGDEQFDYRVLTNAELTVQEGWGVWGERQAGAASMSFGPFAVEGEPKMFFKVETLQKQD